MMQRARTAAQPKQETKSVSNEPLIVDVRSSYEFASGAYPGAINIDLDELQSRVNELGYRDWETDRKSTRLNSSHRSLSRMPSSA